MKKSQENPIISVVSQGEWHVAHHLFYCYCGSEKLFHSKTFPYQIEDYEFRHVCYFCGKQHPAPS